MGHGHPSPFIILALLASAAPTGTSHFSGTTVTKMLPCMETLMRCQNYFTAPVPPPICCEPLQYVVETNAECICAIIFNEAMLAYLGLPFVSALTLPVRCNLTVPDIRICSTFDIPHITLDGVPDGQAANPYVAAASPSSGSADAYVDANGFIIAHDSHSNAGQTKDRAGFTKILTFAIATLLICRTMYFAHMP